MRGELAGRDFNPIGYMPGRYELGALLFDFFGVHLQSLRIGVALLTPAMILGLYATALRVMPAGFAFLAAACLFTVPSMYYNRFFTLFSVLNMFCLVRFFESRKASDGILLACSFLASAYFKFEVALFSVTIACFVFIVSYAENLKKGSEEYKVPETAFIGKRPGFWAAALCIAVLLAVLFKHVYEINLYEKGVKQVLDSYAVWGNPFPNIFPLPTTGNEIDWHRLFTRTLFYIPMALYALSVFLLAIRFYKGWRNCNRAEYHLLIILLFGLCSFGLVLWRSGLDNLMRTLAPSYLLFCYFSYLLWEKAVQSKIIHRVLVNLLAAALPFLFIFEMNTQHGFYAGSIGAMTQETERVTAENIDVFTNKNEAEWIPEVVDRIGKYSEPGDAIFALPLNPIFYFLSNRINPTSYDWILPGMLDEKEQRAVIEQLQSNMPKVIVYVDIAIDGKEERRFVNYAPKIYQYLAENYSFAEQVGIFQILLPSKSFLTLPEQ